AGFIGAMRDIGRPMLYGSPGSGSYIHVTGALFARETGLPGEHVAYRGSAPALTDLAAGRLDVMFENQPGALPFIRDGRLRALAVTSPERSPVLPEVPTMIEAGLPGVIAVPWFALFAPAPTPSVLRERIAADIAAVQGAEEPRRVFETLGIRSEVMGPDALSQLVLRERERMGAVVRAAGIRAE
ncbi:MAG TPA: tripartite tricarboxylate transporter substrate binding protein, partial [Acetobacteraceae bacterium]|nr:tripartite tricarboxylate transporter substrate binding protein [Acetobacteraceae bacterium]